MRIVPQSGRKERRRGATGKDIFTIGLLVRLPPNLRRGWIGSCLTGLARKHCTGFDGGKACSPFSHSLSGIRCTERSSKLMAAPCSVQLPHFDLARVRRRIPASGPWSLSFLPARTAGAEPERPEPGRNKKDSDLFAAENHRPSLRHRRQVAVHESVLGRPQRIPDTRRRSANPRSEPGHGLAVAQERPREVVWQVAAQHRPEGK